jgi:hypothetical protein
VTVKEHPRKESQHVHRLVRRSLTIAAAAVLVTLATAVPAQAAPVGFDIGGDAGTGTWNADPWVDPQSDPRDPTVFPGDAIRACDYEADGWGIKVYLDIFPGWPYDRADWDRSATTQGHNSPYCTWTTGNIAEDTPVAVWGCMVKGDEVKSCTTPKGYKT